MSTNLTSDILGPLLILCLPKESRQFFFAKALITFKKAGKFPLILYMNVRIVPQSFFFKILHEIFSNRTRVYLVLSWALISLMCSDDSYFRMPKRGQTISVMSIEQHRQQITSSPVHISREGIHAVICRSKTTGHQEKKKRIKIK